MADATDGHWTADHTHTVNVTTNMAVGAKDVARAVARYVRSDEPVSEPLTLDVDAEVEVRDAAKREIDVRLVPWDFPIDTLQGREMFARGAFDHVDPTSVMLMGLEHEAHIGIGQNGLPKLVRRPVGRSIALHNKADGEYATFRVAKTAAGDEVLALAEDRIIRNVSVEVRELAGGTTTETHGGRRTLVRRKMDLPGASLTYRPAYGEQAAVLAVRSQVEKEKPLDTQTADTTAAPVNVTVTIPPESFAPLTEAVTTAQKAASDEVITRMAALEEQMRTQINIPAPTETAVPPVYMWLKGMAYRLSGDRMPEEFRTLDDVTAADNPGLVPDAYIPDLEGELSTARPFLESTKKVNAPATGLNITVPTITQHTQTGVQGAEKAEVASRAMETDLDTFPVITIAGAVDVSYQFIKLGDPAAVQIVFDDMAGNYAADAEAQALGSLLDADVQSGGSIDLADGLPLTAALENAQTAGTSIDTVWLSTKALGTMLDAENDAGNPRYPNLTMGGVDGGDVGTVRGLKAVHVPQLTAVDVIIGPSNGFRWAEKGTYRLEADNPALAGRDIGIVGFLYPMPRNAAAFTTYTQSGGG